MDRWIVRSDKFGEEMLVAPGGTCVWLPGVASWFWQAHISRSNHWLDCGGQTLEPVAAGSGVAFKCRPTNTEVGTQQRIADHIGVDQGTVARIMRDGESASPHNLDESILRDALEHPPHSSSFPSRSDFRRFHLTGI